MVVSLFAYFFYIVTAFAAIMGLLVVAFNGSTFDRTLHYPRPVMDHSIAATHLQRPLFLMATKDTASAKSTPASEPKAQAVVAVANPDTEKTKRERPAHPHKIATQRENFGSRDYSIAQGYSAGSSYRPGLDAQR
ncbi:MAG TPA: hypothetical protein VF778_04980 [Xanthobacteraceae bacterium]